jgi:hypothetical protein
MSRLFIENWIFSSLKRSSLLNQQPSCPIQKVIPLDITSLQPPISLVRLALARILIPKCSPRMQDASVIKHCAIAFFEEVLEPHFRSSEQLGELSEGSVEFDGRVDGKGSLEWGRVVNFRNLRGSVG